MIGGHGSPLTVATVNSRFLEPAGIGDDRSVISPRLAIALLGVLAAAAGHDRGAAAMDATVRRAMPDDGAAAVLVARDGEVVLQRGYGEAKPDVAASADTLFDVASVSKQFTAAAVLRLVEMGKLGLDDRLAEHWPAVPPDKAEIRIRHLLDHRSGLPIEVELTDAERADRDAMLKAVLRAPLQFEPGHGFAYSNAGYNVLAALVELASGQSFERFCRRQIFEPAGMTSTGFVGDDGLDESRAAARYEDGDATDATDSAIDWAWHWAFRGASGVVTTVSDLYRWDRVLRAGTVLGPAATAALRGDGDRDYAFGWEHGVTSKGTPRLHHDGRCYGFRSSFTRLPADDGVVIVLGTAAVPVRDLATDLEAELLAMAPPAERLKACAGTFALPDDGTLQLTVHGDTLELRPFGTEATARVRHGVPWSAQDPWCRADVDERALHIVEALAHHSRRTDDDYASTEARDAARACLQRLTQRAGPWREATTIGSTDAPPSSFVAVRCQDGREIWRLRWNDDRRCVAIEPVAEHPFAIALTWRHGRVFAASSLDGNADLEIELDGEGDRPARSLSWRDRSTPSTAPLRARRR